MTFLRILVLAAAWCLLTRELTLLNAALGLALAALLVRTSSGSARAEGAPRGPGGRTLVVALRRAVVRPWRALELATFFLYELVLSNVRIALLVVRPRLRLAPTILSVPVDAESEEELALLSDLVTLTPGTLSLDVEDDGRTLLVHVMDADDPDQVRRDIRDGLARRVRRLFE